MKQTPHHGSRRHRDLLKGFRSEFSSDERGINGNAGESLNREPQLSHYVAMRERDRAFSALLLSTETFIFGIFFFPEKDFRPNFSFALC